MTEPIKPTEVQIDRGIEGAWIEAINAGLAKPWGPDEAIRQIEIQGKFGDQLPIANWVAERYEKAGWKVRYPVTPFNRADKYSGIVFERPNRNTP